MALTDNDITAWATVAAVVAAVGVAWWGNRRSDRQTKQERHRADIQLSQERERSDRQRRIERNIALLVEVYDLHAEFKSPTPGPGRDAALFKLHLRLAVLPWTVATLIRFDIGETLLNDPDSKRAWVADRADRIDVQRGQVGFDLPKYEFPSDLWFLRNDQPHYENRFWWIAYEEAYPPDGGHVAPGVVSPKTSEF